MPTLRYSPTAVFTILANEYPAEIASLVRLPQPEGAEVFRRVVESTPATSETDAAERIAEHLRSLLGLTRDDTETTTTLAREDNDAFEAICASLSR